MSSKVQIRGCGSWSPLGSSWLATWRGLLEANSRLSPYETIRPDFDLPAVVADCPELDRTLEGNELLKGAAFRLFRRACDEALAFRKRSGEIRLYGGTTHGESDILISAVSGEEAVGRQHFQSLILDSTPELLMREFGCSGVEWTYSSCVSGSHALFAAFLDLKSNLVNEALVVSGDALSTIGIAGFRRIGAASQTSCRPFQTDRDGTIVGEGAAALLLDVRDQGRAGDVSLLSFGTSCEAGHSTKPDADGRGLESAVRAALNRADLDPSDIGAIYLHGTGTVSNDSAEAAMYKRVFKGADPPATSLKASLGHSMGAAGLMSCLAAAETVKTGLIPPTIFSGEADSLGVNMVIGTAHQIRKGASVLIQVSAFGGNNVAFVLGQEQ